MHIFLKGQVLSRRQCYLRCNQTLYNRIVRQIQIHNYMVGYTTFLEGTAEELRNIVLNAHGGEYDSEFLIAVISQRRLLYDLRRQLVMRKTVAGEDRKLLPAN